MSIEIPGPNMFMRSQDGWASSGRIGKGIIPSDLSNLEVWYDAAGAYVSSDGAAQFTGANSERLRLSGSAQFTAANSEDLRVADHADLSGGDIEYTMCGWIWTDVAVATARHAFGKWDTGSGSNRELQVRKSTANNIEVLISSDGTGADVILSSGTTMVARRWYFVVAWHDPTADTVNIQVDNGSAVSSAHSTGIFDGTGSFLIGSQNGGVLWDGRIARVGVWKRTLTAAEKTWLYNSGSGRNYSEIGSGDGAALATDLKAWWQLTEISGNRSDSHTGGHTLTDTNTVTSAPFHEKTANFSPGDADFTIAAWVYHDTLSGVDVIAGKWASTLNRREWRLAYNSGAGRYRFLVSNDGTAEVTASSSNFGSASTGRWYFVVGWHDATANTINVQVNNGTANSTSHSTGVFQGDADFMIGMGNNGASNPFDGRIDSIAFWDRTLTAAEKTYLFNHSVGRKYSGIGVANTNGSALKTSLVSWWDLDEVSGVRNDAHSTNHMYDVNTVTNAAGVTGVVANFNDAASESLSIADNSDLSMGDVDFTIAGWFQLDDKSNSYTLLGKWNANLNKREYVVIYQNGADRFQFVVSDDGIVATTESADNLGSPSASTWYFLVCEHDASADTISISVNDGTADSMAHADGVFDSDNAFAIADSVTGGGSNQYLDGKAALVGVWKRTLTAAEKTWLYNNGDGRNYEDFGVTGDAGSNLKTSLIAFWPLNEYSGTRGDAHGSNDLTDNNTVTFDASFQTALGEDVADNSSASRWSDRSGNELDVAQATASLRPSYQTNDVNGLSVVRGDGVDDSIWDTTDSRSPFIFAHDGTGVTLFAVLKSEDTGVGVLVGSMQAAAANTGFSVRVIGTTNRINASVGDGSGTFLIDHLSAVSSFTANAYHILVWRYEEGLAGDDSSIKIDGTEYTANTTGSTPAVGNHSAALRLFADTGAGGDALIGNVAELGIYSERKTDSEVIDLETYLSDKYNIALA